MFFRHLWKSVAYFVCVLASAAAFIVYAPRSYSSKAQYLVRLGHESVSLDPVATVGETMGLYMTSDSIVRSTREILGSDALAVKVVERVGANKILDRDPTITPSLLARVKQVVSDLDPISAEEKARITLQKYLDISSPTQSNVIVVSYESSYPELSLEVMQAVSDVFLEEHNRINRTEGSFEFFVEQDEILLRALNAASTAVTQAKQDFGISSIEGKRNILESRLADIEAAVSSNERGLAATKSRVQETLQQLADTPDDIVLGATSGSDQQTSAALHQQLYDLQIREKELLSKYTADHPNLQSVQQQLKEVTDIFASMNLSDTATSRGVNPVHQQLRIQLLTEQANLQAELATREVLSKQSGQLKKDLLELNAQDEKLARLQTEMEVAKSKYEAHASKLEQARLEQELGSKEITSIGVIQSPSLNERPVSPNKKLVALLGFVMACFGALALPFALEYLRDDQQVNASVQSDREYHALETTSEMPKHIAIHTAAELARSSSGETLSQKFVLGKK
ncbi:MAG: hypothetical protein R3C53_10565 [Pirellulaceae bacterium]